MLYLRIIFRSRGLGCDCNMRWYATALHWVVFQAVVLAGLPANMHVNSRKAPRLRGGLYLLDHSSR